MPPVARHEADVDAVQRSPRWSCVGGIAAEGARSPGASNHVVYLARPKVIYGVSPIEAGRLATERADRARDGGEKFRKLRRDGIYLLAGVVSDPWDYQSLSDDPVDSDAYSLWQQMTLGWLRERFDEHLSRLRDDGRLDINSIHPGRRAAAAGAGHNNSEGRIARGCGSVKTTSIATSAHSSAMSATGPADSA